MDDFHDELLLRMPLAKAVLLLFSHVLNQQFLDRLFEQHRGRSYEAKLSFHDIVHLIKDALIVHQGSGRASFQKAQENNRLPSTLRAVYGKLSRIPLPLSTALLKEATARLQHLLPASSTPITPPCLNAFTTIVLDGKTIKHVARQIKALRNRRGKVTSGKMLVALSLQNNLALAFEPSLSSEANDVILVDGLLEQLQKQLEEIRLFIADRQFCDLPRLEAFIRQGDHFLIRHNGNLHFHADAARASREGSDPHGRRFVEEWGWLGPAKHPRRQYVRRITLFRPQEEDVSLVTDLLDEQAYPAEQLLDAYLQRWGIERVFQQVTEVFDLRNLIGGLPQATLFQASFCLLLYNIIQVVRGYVAGAGERQVEEVSTELLFEDCRQELCSWALLGDADATAGTFSVEMSVEEMKDELKDLLGDLWRERWLKSPRQKKHGKTKTTIYPKKGYTNLWKLLQEEQQSREKKKQKS